MRLFILCLGILGIVVFGGAFTRSYTDPMLVERLGKEIARIEIERRVGAKVDALTDSALTSRVTALAQKALGKTDAEIEEMRNQIKADIPKKVASVMADMLKVDCECRARMLALAQKGWIDRLTSLIEVRQRLGDLIEHAYQEVSARLLREFRIFTGANALVFLALTAVAARRRQARVQLVLPTLVLLGAAAITSALYLFGQNWLHTIIFGAYWGWAYFGYLGLALALLGDIAFNKARVSTTLIQSAFDAVGASIDILPC
ncbi:MAG: hypothetical protein FWG56_00935 [Desulfovibrionaceae bacterium]|nr:hypothetical protein [Desulfovibrionaceae bacterium]